MYKFRNLSTSSVLVVILLLSLVSLSWTHKVSIVDSSDNSNSGSSAPTPYVEAYLSQRSKLVATENALKIGSKIVFTEKENQANELFSNILLQEELKYSNIDPSSYNFLKKKDWIDENSVVFNILKHMPKGSGLHIHQDSSASYDYLIDVGSYLPNCYIYLNDSSNLNGTFTFFNSTPTDDSWHLLESIRANSTNVKELDKQLLKSLTLEDQDFGDYIELWRKFDGIFARVRGLVTYVPIGVGYMEHLCDQMIQDNVQHIELRKYFGDFYDINGNLYNDTWFVQQMESLSEKVRIEKKMPQFNIKIIGCDGRHSDPSLVLEHMRYSLQLLNQFPKTFVGYDLVGPEDEGYPLIHFIDQFAIIEQESKQYERPLQYYFHAGETLLYNNTNLYDAILLKSKRIGHGIQLAQHPELESLIIENQIGIEVCPISNQILEYVADMRAHPALVLFNRDLPITISPDDPAIFNVIGLSYDFYEVTYAWGLDLKQLKQLALNSINVSSFYDDNEKNLSMKYFLLAWDQFIDYIIKNYNNNTKI